jgi:response regulator NasT
MLLVASPDICNEHEVADIMCLSMPLKVHELIQTVETMSYTITRMRKKRRTEPKVRSEEEKRMLQDAKELLMVRNNMSEEEAHRYIQKRSMDNGTGLIETAQMILSLMHA